MLVYSTSFFWPSFLEALIILGAMDLETAMSCSASRRYMILALFLTLFNPLRKFVSSFRGKVTQSYQCRQCLGVYPSSWFCAFSLFLFPRGRNLSFRNSCNSRKRLGFENVILGETFLSVWFCLNLWLDIDCSCCLDVGCVWILFCNKQLFFCLKKAKNKI